MLEIADELLGWSRAGRPFAVATVVAVSGSAPRQPGATMAVDSDGNAVGSISGGCVEAAVYELGLQLLADGEDAVSRLERFGYSDTDAFAVGLTCGGVLDVFVQRVDPRRRPELLAALGAGASGRAAALVRIVDGPEHLLGRAVHVHADGECEGGLGDRERDRTAMALATSALATGGVTTIESGCDEHRVGLLVETRTPPPRMLVFGAIDFAAALVRVGKLLGHHVTVCDARAVFATRRRFPDADEVVVDWPHRYLDSQSVDSRTVICVLTHDLKFDIPLLARALRLPVGYVGAMASRRTHLRRVAALREVGITEAELARLRSPIGLDLGGSTPLETALSIAAEIVACRHGGTGQPLSSLSTPVHHGRTLPDGSGATVGSPRLNALMHRTRA
ncbi:XdhC family protein [Kutzneria sp. NPDC052558]|uniref:XdhC family protein n=1 Tax=Kutzneria sp. NPDC052558 TaxID=3364121 RepID=UPI0037CA9D99